MKTYKNWSMVLLALLALSFTPVNAAGLKLGEDAASMVIPARPIHPVFGPPFQTPRPPLAVLNVRDGNRKVGFRNNSRDRKSVPEPAGVAGVFAAGLVGLALLRRK
jgi:hypothetical protein